MPKRLALSLLALAAPLLPATEAPAPHGPVPTDAQVSWLRMEWYAFVHFGLNTYTDREWGYGNESPALFNPEHFHARRIAATFRKAGMTGLIYTAKHHDGWCAWPTATTAHSVSASPWKHGKGDVVREFARACEAEGLAFGVYISPWDRNSAHYARPAYTQLYHEQVRELLTRYGAIFEIWFDGANGGDGYYGGAQEKRNIGDATRYYDYAGLVQSIRSLQPRCIIWGAGKLGDAEWGGSEKGHVPYPCSNIRQVNGQPRWISLEGDTPINKRGWFWHPGQETAVKPPAQLMQVYMDSVGRGANLILNVAPNRDGQLDAADVASLLAFGQMRRKLLATDYALGAEAHASETRGNNAAFAADKLTDGDLESYWCPEDGTTTATLGIRLREPRSFDVIRLREQIRLGQRVTAFEIDAWLEGKWQCVDEGGKSIGHQVMRQLASPITTDRLRVRITGAEACPCISELSLLRMPEAPAMAEAKADTGLDKKGWKTMSQGGARAIDGQPERAADITGSMVVDMGRVQRIEAFSYLPPQESIERIIDRYRFEISLDGKTWKTVAEGEFSNMRATPIEQRVSIRPSRARYWRFTPLRTLGGGRTAGVAEINIYRLNK